MYRDCAALEQRVARYRTARIPGTEHHRSFRERVDLCWLVHDFAMDGVALIAEDVERALAFAEPHHHCDGQRLAAIRIRRDAIAWVRGFAKQHRGALSLDDLKQFHVAACKPGEASSGRYRKSNGPMLPYVHTIAKHASISYYLRRLVDSLASAYGKLHPVKAAAMAHHDFMAAWPFDERTPAAGRLLLNFLLLRAGYPPAIIHARDRASYFHALGGRPQDMVSVVQGGVGLTLDFSDSLLGARAA